FWTPRWALACDVLQFQPLLPFRRQRRNPPVWRIDDERGPFGADDLRASIPPEVVVGERDVTSFRRAVDDGALLLVAIAVCVAALDGLLLVVGRFLIGQDRLVRKFRRPLERSHRAEVPNALQIGLTVHRTRHNR